MKVSTLFEVLDTEYTAVRWIDKEGCWSLNNNWIPRNWTIIKMYVDSDGYLVVYVDGDFNEIGIL